MVFFDHLFLIRDKAYKEIALRTITLLLCLFPGSQLHLPTEILYISFLNSKSIVYNYILSEKRSPAQFDTQDFLNYNYLFYLKQNRFRHRISSWMISCGSEIIQFFSYIARNVITSGSFSERESPK